MTERNEGEQKGTVETQDRPKRRSRLDGMTVPLLIGGRKGNSVDVVVLAGTVFHTQMRQARRVGALGHTGGRRR